MRVIFMFVESGCISTNIEFTVPKEYSFYLSTDINFMHEHILIMCEILGSHIATLK